MEDAENLAEEGKEYKEEIIDDIVTVEHVLNPGDGQDNKALEDNQAEHPAVNYGRRAEPLCINTSEEGDKSDRSEQ